MPDMTRERRSKIVVERASLSKLSISEDNSVNGETSMSSIVAIQNLFGN